MELRYALLAHFANVTQEGNLNVMGIFDRLFAPQFPAVHRQLYLVTCMATDPEDEGQTRQLEIQLIDADGNVLTELKGEINFGIGKQVFNQLHLFQDLQFPAAGSYQFNIFFDGHPVKTIDLELQQVAIQPPGPPV